jgi:hypothetical protein
VRPFAPWAATRASDPLPVLKKISTFQTSERSDIELFPLGRYGADNMKKMLINLFFPDSRCLGEFPGAHFLFTQKDDHLLANRLHFAPIFFLPSSIVYGLLPKSPEANIKEFLLTILDVIVKSRNQTAKKKDPDARRANPEE